MVAGISKCWHKLSIPFPVLTQCFSHTILPISFLSAQWCLSVVHTGKPQQFCLYLWASRTPHNKGYELTSTVNCKTLRASLQNFIVTYTKCLSSYFLKSDENKIPEVKNIENFSPDDTVLAEIVKFIDLFEKIFLSATAFPLPASAAKPAFPWSVPRAARGEAPLSATPSHNPPRQPPAPTRVPAEPRNPQPPRYPLAPSLSVSPPATRRRAPVGLLSGVTEAGRHGSLPPAEPPRPPSFSLFKLRVGISAEMYHKGVQSRPRAAAGPEQPRSGTPSASEEPPRPLLPLPWFRTFVRPAASQSPPGNRPLSPAAAPRCAALPRR